MLISGAHFHEFAKLSIENLKISNYHTLDWATNLLNRFGPVQNTRNITIWMLESVGPFHPSTITSEHDTMSHIQISILHLALATAKFLRSQHLGLSAPDPRQFKLTNWAGGLSNR